MPELGVLAHAIAVAANGDQVAMVDATSSRLELHRFLCRLCVGWAVDAFGVVKFDLPQSPTDQCDLA